MNMTTHPQSNEPAKSTATDTRRAWMAVLAKAPTDALVRAWGAMSGKPAYRHLRRPETGLVMVRGRAGGTGQRFNLGEMTVSRCAVALENGIVGHGYVAGRDHRKAELAAIFDALLQDSDRRAEVEALVTRPLSEAQAARKAERRRKAAATRVEFLTMVRDR
ncbi:phosphonate C-P lyase system protein PhnG [Virgifigura deserti]|uniref:phosphonate C-P lyase system protein PhnG n=1 Tax=Virgifigura deserti TaxID=2268457 RepID=UPI003CCC4596